MKFIRVLKASETVEHHHKSIKKQSSRYEGSQLLKYIGKQIEEGYQSGFHPTWELKVTINGSDINDLNLSTSARDYIREICSYPIQDGYTSYMGVEIPVEYAMENTFDKTDLEELDTEPGGYLYANYELILGEDEINDLEDDL